MFPRTHLLKKKLNKNQYRSIILAKGGQYWIDEYLFAKKDRDNLGGLTLFIFPILFLFFA
jgi:hypothetical protein